MAENSSPPPAPPAVSSGWLVRNRVKLIRRLHLYLGCFFTPLLLFFVLTGWYQTVNPDRLKSPGDAETMLQKLRTVHTDQLYPSAVEFKQPYLAHPNLELFVGATSPHSMKSIGCTVCHEGSGEETDFILAAHTPKSHAEDVPRYECGFWSFRIGSDRLIPFLPFQVGIVHYALQHGCEVGLNGS